MKYQEWFENIPKEITEDPIWEMRVYQQALFLSHLAWYDATKLAKDKRTLSLSSQLLRAGGSIGANISEGYSRGSKKDQARFFEYALGSARESRDWYYQSRHVLGEDVVSHRLGLIANIVRQLLAIIPKHRGHRINEDEAEYHTDTSDPLLAEIPLPE